MERNNKQATYQPPCVQLRAQHHDLALPPSWLADKTYHQHVGMGEVLSLAPKQNKLSEVHATINLLNQELSDFGYSPYTFLRGFTSHSAQQCTLPGGYICKEEEGGYSLNPKLLDPLRRALATLQDVMDLLEESLPPSEARRHFQVDSDQYWIQRLELANELGKVFNVASGLHTHL